MENSSEKLISEATNYPPMTTEILIRIRKIRDHMGVMKTNSKLSFDEREHIGYALVELAKILYIFTDSCNIGGQELAGSNPENLWEAYL